MAHNAKPQRQCIGCRRVKPKEDLLRLMKAAAGAPVFDHAGRMPGRGAYICPDDACLRKAFQTKRGRNARNTLINVTELASGIRRFIAQDMEHLIARAEKMGYVLEYCEDIAYSGDSYIVYGSNGGELSIAKRAIGDAATVQGEGSHPCGDDFKRPRIIKSDYPFIRDLLRGLNVLQRLSSEVQ